VFPPQTAYPKPADFYVNINSMLSPPKEEVNLHLEIDGLQWKVEILAPRTFDEHYWLARPADRVLEICGIYGAEKIAGIKRSCWQIYHTKP
jgi:hypothetical protein